MCNGCTHIFLNNVLPSFSKLDIVCCFFNLIYLFLIVIYANSWRLLLRKHPWVISLRYVESKWRWFDLRRRRWRNVILMRRWACTYEWWMKRTSCQSPAERNATVWWRQSTRKKAVIKDDSGARSTRDLWSGATGWAPPRGVERVTTVLIDTTRRTRVGWTCRRETRASIQWSTWRPG